MEDILSTGKFAILLHQGKGPEHYDLVLEGLNLCPTFQFDQKELTTGQRIQDHRKKYLNFEGLISPEKGTVGIIKTGTYKCENNQIQLTSSKEQCFYCYDSKELLIKVK